jgi:hypothetical protein
MVRMFAKIRPVKFRSDPGKELMRIRRALKKIVKNALMTRG